MSFSRSKMNMARWSHGKYSNSDFIYLLVLFKKKQPTLAQTKVLLTFSWGIKMGHWAKRNETMAQITRNN